MTVGSTDINSVDKWVDKKAKVMEKVSDKKMADNLEQLKDKMMVDRKALKRAFHLAEGLEIMME